MSDPLERAAAVALLREGRRSRREYAAAVDECGSALALFEEERGLLAETELAPWLAEIERWAASGYQLLTLLDDDYPGNLRAVHDRPLLLFIAGSMTPADRRSVAVIGSRTASPGGREIARRIVEQCVAMNFTVVSGLAAGIDRVAHTATLAAGGRTLAVIGTGLEHAYPPENGELQAELAARGAVISQFWPDAVPTRRSFPMRNAVMSGITLASVIVEASEHSGTRTQARAALAHGRPVIIWENMLNQTWARELTELPGVHVVGSPTDVTRTIERLTSPGALTT
jgi:DNA processing protein